MLDANRDEATAIAQNWLDALAGAIAKSDEVAIGAMFEADGYWRDVVAFTWTYATFAGRDEISRELLQQTTDKGFTNLQVDTSALAPGVATRVNRDVIEVFIAFETTAGRGRGIVRLSPDASGPDGQHQAWTLLTTLEELKEFEEPLEHNRPKGQSHSRDFRGPNWLDQRNAAVEYDGRNPDVIIVGGGQAGLATAARLTQLGVDALIVDRGERIGDNWRKRYHALTLHNQVQVNHLPYMPFPPNWPTYIPKDKLANWFESYVDAMELNYWTSTEFLGATYDEAAGQWTVALERDGKKIQLQPKHIVMATGVSGIPNMPKIPTLENFKGRVTHSSGYQDGEDWTGKTAIVIGTGNSGHDISQDLASSGADVTIVQRNPTLVTAIEPSAQLPYTLYDTGPSLDECDLIATSMPKSLVWQAHQHYTAQSRELDKDLLASLRKIGFRLDHGEDDTGWQFKYLTRGGGYYFNVGASDMMIDGKIKLLAYDDIEAFTETGIKLTNGETRDADLIVLATGYKPQEVLVERLFGEDIKDRVGPIWGFGEGDELRNMYVRTGQPGLWFIAGSLAQCRINSKYLALQLKACLEGMISVEKPSL